MPQALSREVLAYFAVGLPVLLVFGIGELLYRRGLLAVEGSRKLAHLGSGAVVLALPWAVGTHWTVLALSVGFVAVLAGSRVLGWLPSIHAVERRTKGAQLYPVAVYLTFLLAQGDALLYVLPIAVMAVGDTGAALAGARWSLMRYRVVEDHRSLGGSATFFGLAFVLSVVALALSGRATLPGVMVISLLLALVATAVEAVSVRGLDNLLVPYACQVVLLQTLGAPSERLGQWVQGFFVTLALLLGTRRRVGLNLSGLLGLLLVGGLTWGLGGPSWLLLLLLPYLGLVLVGSRAERDLATLAPSCAASLVLVLAQGHWEQGDLFLPFAASVAAATAQQGMSFARGRGLGVSGQAGAAGLGAGATLAVAGLLPAGATLTWSQAASVLLAGLSAAGLLRLWPRAALPEGLGRVVGIAAGTAGALLLGAL